MKKILLLVFPVLLLLFSCHKDSGLGDLKPNNMEPGNGIDVFVFDSVQTNPYPFAKIFYHINYSPIADPSRIYKIVVYRGGVPVFYLLPSASNAFSPTDLGVSRFSTYDYQFGLMESDNTVSKVSAHHLVYIP
ncbi:MAG: hypothetical protein ACJ77K_14635 [Bacteroidia bacterium]